MLAKPKLAHSPKGMSTGAQQSRAPQFGFGRGEEWYERPHCLGMVTVPMGEAQGAAEAPRLQSTPTVRGTDLRLVAVAVSTWLGVLCGLRAAQLLPVARAAAILLLAAAMVSGFLLMGIRSAAAWGASAPGKSKGVGVLSGRAGRAVRAMVPLRAGRALGPAEFPADAEGRRALQHNLLRRGGAFAIVACAAGALGGILMGSGAATRFWNDPLTLVAHGQGTVLDEGSQFVVVTGRLSASAVPIQTPWARGALRLEVAAQSVFRASRREASSADLWVELPRDLQGDDRLLVPGAVVELRGLLESEDWLRPPVAGRLRATSIRLVAAAPRWQELASDLRALMLQAVGVAGIDGPLISGMSLGEDSLLDPRVKKAMVTTSLTHLTAVSGSHIAITLAVVNWVLRGRRRIQACATVVFLLLMTGIVGPEPSVIRAAAMGSLVAWGMLWRRPSQPLAMLGAVALAVVLVEPWLAVSVGFSLSCLASAGIILLARPLGRMLLARVPYGGIARTVLTPVASTAAVALTAQVATLPILALLNPWLPAWGVVANLAVAPVVAPLTLLGLGVAMTCPWAPALAGALVHLATPLAAWVRIVAEQVSAWPLAQAPWVQGPGGSGLVLLATALCAFGIRAIRRASRVDGCID